MLHRKFSWLFGTTRSAGCTPEKSKKSCVHAPRRWRPEVVQLEDRTVPSTLLGATANTFAVLSGSAVTNTGATTINGSVGVSPGSAITGFPPGIVTGGAIHNTDAVALQAQNEVTTTYNDLSGLSPTASLTGQDLGGLTLTPGVYNFATTAQLTGTLTLDGLGDPNATFVFQIGSTLTTASNSSVVFLNGAEDDEVYWQVGSSATLGTSSAFAGNIVALTSVTLNTGSSIACGRALARNGAVTLDDNNITIVCAGMPGSISGRKINDLNGDGVLQAQEPGLAGVTLYLDANHNDAFDIGEMSTTSDSNGDYTFLNLQAGTYRVREAQQAGLLQTTTNPADVTLSDAQNKTGVDFGDFRVITLSGAKFNDVNGNGVRDVDDTGIAGVTIFLDANNDGVLNSGEVSTTSDDGGNYSFSNVGPGSYRVREVVPAGWMQTTANPATIVASSGTNVAGVLIGNFRLVSITGSAFQDTNANGVRNAGEAGMPGQTIYLDTNHNGILDTGERRTVTDINGNYTFANLGPGTYRVRQVEQLGFIQMSNNPADVTVSSGVNNTVRPFANARAAGIMGASKLSLTSGNMSSGVLAQQARIVENLYETFLGRAPDLAGLQRYVRLLQAGYNQQQVTAMFRSNYRV